MFRIIFPTTSIINVVLTSHGDDDDVLDDRDDDVGEDERDDVGDLSLPIGWSQARLPCSGCERCSSSLLKRQNAQTITLHPHEH